MKINFGERIGIAQIIFYAVMLYKIEFIIEFIADQDDFRVRIGEMRLPKRIIQIITVALMNENQR